MLGELICPKCKSANTKKISVMSEDWKIGRHRCLDCNYMDHWLFFCSGLSKEQQENIHRIGNQCMREFGYIVEDDISNKEK